MYARLCVVLKLVQSHLLAPDPHYQAVMAQRLTPLHLPASVTLRDGNTRQVTEVPHFPPSSACWSMAVHNGLRHRLLENAARVSALLAAPAMCHMTSCQRRHALCIHMCD